MGQQQSRSCFATTSSFHAVSYTQVICGPSGPSACSWMAVEETSVWKFRICPEQATWCRNGTGTATPLWEQWRSSGAQVSETMFFHQSTSSCTRRIIFEPDWSLIRFPHIVSNNPAKKQKIPSRFLQCSMVEKGPYKVCRGVNVHMIHWGKRYKVLPETSH